MEASDLFREGKLDEAIEKQIALVRSAPADHNKRLFLFELLVFRGDLEKAMKQADVISYKEIELETALQAYKKLVESEEKRRRFFSQGLLPSFLTAPPDHVTLRMEAVNRLREGNDAEASELLEQANERIPQFQGMLNQKMYKELRDADDLFGSVVEVMAKGEYFWVPLEQVATIAMNPPSFPRDLMWIPARLEMLSGTAGEVYMPALYPQTYEHEDPQIKLGYATDWITTENGPVLGRGAKTYLVDDDASVLLEWREFQVLASEVAPPESDETASGEAASAEAASAEGETATEETSEE